MRFVFLSRQLIATCIVGK